MYREGPPGSPFHTLLVEGYIDGPIDACKSDTSHKKISRFCHVMTSIKPFVYSSR